MKVFSGTQRRRGASRLAILFGLGAAALLAAGVAIANPDPPPVSGADPYASCTAGAPGFNFPSTEVEPYVAVNPTNGSNIVGVYQQDRWDNGGARGLAASVSMNGGTTWTTVALPFSECGGGISYQRASDPWISFGPDGTAYAVGHLLRSDDDPQRRGRGRLARRRHDMGRRPHRHHRQEQAVRRQGLRDRRPQASRHGVRRVGSCQQRAAQQPAVVLLAHDRLRQDVEQAAAHHEQCP